MPARRKGKGFTRKKKRKSTSPASSSSGQQKRKAPPASVKKAAPKTPANTGNSSAAASKRKAKQALALSLPRRVSPRLAAFAKRKSMENGSVVIPAGTAPAEEEENLNNNSTQEAPDHDHDHDHDQYQNQNQDQDRSYVFLQNQVIHREIHHRLDINKSVVPSKLPALKMKSVANIDNNNNGKDDGHVEIPDEDFEDEIPLVGDDDQDDEHMMFDRGTGPIKEPQEIVVDVSLKEVEDDFESHAVFMYFWRTGGLTVTRQHVKEWIYNNVGDRETIGSIRYCRDVAKGFFSVYFEQAVARNKALETKGQQRGLQVTVFPWCSATVNDEGQQCSPRMLVLPGLPDQFLPFLPTIGNSLGTYIGSIGALDPDADMDQVRLQGAGWESAYNVTPASDNTSPRIAVMIPPEYKIPHHIRLQVRPGVYKQQPIYEQLSSSMVSAKRKAAYVYACTPPSASYRGAAVAATTPSASKKLRA